MAKIDFKSEWERTKKEFSKLSKEAVKAAKRGEEGLIKASRRGKLYLDSTAVSLKRERLYHLIGKEYVSLEDPLVPSAKLDRLIDELRRLESEEKAIKVRIKQEQKGRSSRG